MNDTTPQHRVIPDRLDNPLRSALLSWEVLLLGVAVAIFIVNSFASPYFLDPYNLSDATFNFTEKALIAFAMALLIISGEIDLSVAGIIALSSTLMGAAAQMGVDTPGLVAHGADPEQALETPEYPAALGDARPGAAGDRRDHRLPVGGVVRDLVPRLAADQLAAAGRLRRLQQLHPRLQ